MENEALEEKDSLEEQDEQQVEEEPKEESVPLPKYMSEKKKRQDLERQIATLKAAQERTEQENQYVKDGVDPETAKLIAAQDAKLAKLEDARISDEIQSLAQKEMYSDAVEHAEAIKKAMKDYGVTADRAYMMTVWDDLKAKEFSEKQAQLALYKEEQEIEPGPAGVKKQKTFPNWTKDDDEALKGLQKAQPNAGWTKETYYKSIYG